MIRFKLTLWNTGVLCLLTSLVGIIVYASVRVRTFDAIDRELLSQAEVASEVWANLSSPVPIPPFPVPKLDVIAPNPIGGSSEIARAEFLVTAPTVFRTNGDPLFLEFSREGLDKKAILAAINKPRSLHTIQKRIAKQSVNIRVVTALLTDDEKGQAVMQTGKSLREAEGYLADLRNLLFFLIPSSWFIALGAGLFLTDRAMRPLKNLNAAARALENRPKGSRLPSDSRDEVDALADTFNLQLDRLEDSYDRLERFSADASHELRTPLTSMLANVSRPNIQQLPKEELFAIIGSVKEGAQSMSALVDDLIFFAREDRYGVELELTSADLAKILGEVADDHVPVLGDRLSLALSAEIHIHGNFSLLKRLFSNLIENAITHGGKDVTLSIKVRKTSESIEVTFQDDGPGVEKEHLPHLFDRFFQADPSRTRSGSGLGLSIAKRIAERHKGEIMISSEPGKGFCVVVRLPSSQT